MQIMMEVLASPCPDYSFSLEYSPDNIYILIQPNSEKIILPPYLAMRISTHIIILCRVKSLSNYLNLMVGIYQATEVAMTYIEKIKNRNPYRDTLR